MVIYGLRYKQNSPISLQPFVPDEMEGKWVDHKMKMAGAALVDRT
jgi:hypothetical protein